MVGIDISGLSGKMGAGTTKDSHMGVIDGRWMGAYKISHAGYILRLILDAVADDGGVEEGGFELR